MTGFSFLNLGQAAQGRQPVRQEQTPIYPGAPQLTPLQAADPRSAYLARALSDLQSGGHEQGNTMGLASNLLAEALDRYALNKRQQQLATPAGGISVQGGGMLPPDAQPPSSGISVQGSGNIYGAPA
ncbi:hypothetical protein ACO2Q3_22625 [Caulobacter sp. KR2-114]|uniref:hypothetical protein n=1 Tax=Caulobacter sp. KR2-114 TaxID=3400912 RepID=UPI003BFECAB6